MIKLLHVPTVPCTGTEPMMNINPTMQRRVLLLFQLLEMVSFSIPCTARLLGDCDRSKFLSFSNFRTASLNAKSGLIYSHRWQVDLKAFDRQPTAL